MRRVIAGIGGACVMFGLGADAIVGGAPGFGRLQIVLMLCGSGLFLIGVLGRRSVGLYRAIAVVALNTLLLCVATELTAGVLLRVWPRFEGEERAGTSYFAGEPWGAGYVEEYAAIHGRKMYQPYVVWRTPAFRGNHINVDDRGIRHTVGSDCRPGSFRIFAFGGSTMWGVGAPDWGTIPSYLIAELDHQVDQPLCVQNFGEHGHVSTQGVVQLIRELEKGNVPDLVIFYDGVNDVFSAALMGEAGLHYELPHIKAKFEGTDQSRSDWIREQNSYRLLTRFQPTRAPGMKPAPPGVADDVARTYVNNHRIVGILAAEYGFGYEFFWQPNLIAGIKPRTGAEERILEKVDPVAADFVNDAYRRVRGEIGTRAHMHDIVDAFEMAPGWLYIDWMHLTPEGNRIVARAMADRLVTHWGLAGGNLHEGPRAAAEN